MNQMTRPEHPRYATRLLKQQLDTESRHYFGQPFFFYFSSVDWSS